MTQKDFDKSDIPALDFIVDRALETQFKVYSNDLVDAGFIKKGSNAYSGESGHPFRFLTDTFL